MTDQQTRQRILYSAAELFAESGFKKTTVRQICKAARANSAAIHYHFGDKGGLYKAVLLYAVEIKPEAEYPPGASGEERLGIWVQAMVHSCLGQPPTLISRLMTLELSEPTEYISLMITHMVAPKMAELQGSIIEIIGEQTDSAVVERFALSVIGQVLAYDHSRAVIDLVFPHFDRSEESLAGLAAHVTDASIGMLHNYREKENKNVQD